MHNSLKTILLLAIGTLLWIAPEPGDFSIGPKDQTELAYDRQTDVSDVAEGQVADQSYGCACLPGFPCFPECVPDDENIIDNALEKQTVPVGNDNVDAGRPDG
jgi:hypothetical protein